MAPIYVPSDGKRLTGEEIVRLADASGRGGVVEEEVCRKGKNPIGYSVRPGEDYDPIDYKMTINELGLKKENSERN